MKQILMNIKGKVERTIAIVRDFNTLTSMDRSSRQRINQEIVALNDTVGQMDLIDTFRAFHSKAAKYEDCPENIQLCAMKSRQLLKKVQDIIIIIHRK